MKLRTKILATLLLGILSLTTAKAYALSSGEEDSGSEADMNVDAIINKKIMLYGNIVDLKSVAHNLNSVLDRPSKIRLNEIADSIGHPNRTADAITEIDSSHHVLEAPRSLELLELLR